MRHLRYSEVLLEPAAQDENHPDAAPWHVFAFIALPEILECLAAEEAVLRGVEGVEQLRPQGVLEILVEG